MRSRFVFETRLNTSQTFEEILRRLLRIPGGINKTDGVREFIVPEEKVEVLITHRKTIRFIEIFAYKGVGGKRPRQYSFVGGDPANPCFQDKAGGFRGDGSFRWPQALRRAPEAAGIVLLRAPQLFPGIFRMLKTVDGKRQLRERDAGHFGINEKRKDGVIKRSRCHFNLTAVLQFLVFGHHEPTNLELLSGQLLFFFFGEFFPLFE